MAISVFDLFKIGIGPSSSHTVGPMRAALRFATGLRDGGELQQTTLIKAELFGSLGATGKAHGSDKGVMLGLEGEQPETIDPQSLSARLMQIREHGRLKLLASHEIEFRENEHLIFHRRQSLPYHPNGMRFTAFDRQRQKLYSKVYYSVGAASATGYQGAASATGTRGAAMSSGWKGRAMGAEGCALFLVERADNDNILAVWAGIAGHDGIKPNVWYQLINGKPVEVN